MSIRRQILVYWIRLFLSSCLLGIFLFSFLEFLVICNFNYHWSFLTIKLRTFNLRPTWKSGSGITTALLLSRHNLKLLNFFSWSAMFFHAKKKIQAYKFLFSIFLSFYKIIISFISVAFIMHSIYALVNQSQIWISWNLLNFFFLY